MTSAFAAAAPPRLQQDNEIFHGLFSDPGRTGPVAAVVSQLWGVSAVPQARTERRPSAGMMIDLFKDDERGDLTARRAVLDMPRKLATIYGERFVKRGALASDQVVLRVA